MTEPPVLVNGNCSLYVLIFPVPVGAATKAGGQEDEKMDEGKKEPDGQAKAVFI